MSVSGRVKVTVNEISSHYNRVVFNGSQSNIENKTAVI